MNRKLLALVAKELYTTFTNRNLILIMFVTPLVLSTIIGLAFGGGGDGGVSISNIPVVIVNQDAGMQFGSFGTEAAIQPAVAEPPFRFGDQLVTILSGGETNQPASTTDQDGAFALPSCELAATDGAPAPTFSTTLEELLTATVLDDVAAARAAIEQGDAAAAVIIPPGFSQSMLPTFVLGGTGQSPVADGTVEIYGDPAQAISAGIVRSVVEGIVNQFGRSAIALSALADALGDEIAPDALAAVELDTAQVPEQDAPWAEWRVFLAPLAAAGPWFAALLNADGSVVSNLACLFSPDLNVIHLEQVPLDMLQARSLFSRVLVAIGSAQAVFFALFTGIFGVASIYEERTQWTLQRLLVTPTPRAALLSGKLGSNVVVIWLQIALLLLALTVVASVVAGGATWIWGSNLLLLIALVVALSVAVSGLGIFVVGIARTQEQVQLIGPMIATTLGALGGAFGFQVPEAIARISLVYWGVDAFETLAAGQNDIALHLLVLGAQGLVFFAVGTWLFRRRVSL